MAGKSDGKDQMRLRAFIVLGLLALFVIPCCVAMYVTMQVDGPTWRSLSQKIKNDSVVVPQVRGSIYASGGQLLASSIPVYVLYMDFKAAPLKRDTFLAKVDSLSNVLSEFNKDRTPAEYKKYLMEGFKKGSKYYKICRRELSYVEMKQVKQFPLFNKVKCYIFEERVKRIRPYGDMASRTVGGLYAVDKGGSSGIEMYCDSLLKGRPGLAKTVKLAGAWRNISELDAENGSDIVLTIDANIQDIVDTDLRNRLAMSEAEHGCAAVMEVATGEIKAISNLTRTASGDYTEQVNYLVAGQGKALDPGSTFKIASAVVALEAGVVDTSTIIDTGNGAWNFYGQTMHDSHPNGKISFNRAIQQSSNIAMAKVIDGAYSKKPEAFIDALYDLGLVMPVGLEVPGVKASEIKHPILDKNDKTKPWHKTSLPWIAHGYETKVYPIQTLTFYNALANGGDMVRPHLLKEIRRNGEVVKSFGTEVLKSNICSKGTIDKVRQMMIDVVEYGTATAAKSKFFKIAGKTGTANQTYHTSKINSRQQLTFCGFFPADKPKYSIIVVAWYPHKGAMGAGSLSGATFRDIAEHIYAQSPSMHVAPAMEKTDASLFDPVTKDGGRRELEHLMDELKINYRKSDDKGMWIRTHVDEKGIHETVEGDYARDRVPNVIGMGLKDALFLLENRGLKVVVEGAGAVVKQSLDHGRFISDDVKEIHLVLR